jgi:hypothetical protein
MSPELQIETAAGLNHTESRSPGNSSSDTTVKLHGPDKLVSADLLDTEREAKHS